MFADQLFADQLAEIRQTRAYRPAAVAEAAAQRPRPATLLGTHPEPRGQLMIGAQGGP